MVENFLEKKVSRTVEHGGMIISAVDPKRTSHLSLLITLGKVTMFPLMSGKGSPLLESQLARGDLSIMVLSGAAASSPLCRQFGAFASHHESILMRTSSLANRLCSCSHSGYSIQKSGGRRSQIEG